jgi:hypothetical protein
MSSREKAEQLRQRLHDTSLHALKKRAGTISSISLDRCGGVSPYFTQLRQKALSKMASSLVNAIFA